MSLYGYLVFKDVSFGKGNRARSMLFHQGKKCCVSTEQRREESSAHGCHSRPFHPLPDPHPERYGLGRLCDLFSLLRERASRAPSSSAHLPRHPQSGWPQSSGARRLWTWPCSACPVPSDGGSLARGRGLEPGVSSVVHALPPFRQRDRLRGQIWEHATARGRSLRTRAAHQHPHDQRRGYRPVSAETPGPRLAVGL